MPPTKRKATKNQIESGGSDDEDYRKKRDRNNQAVKRSRVKSKEKATHTKSRVDDLKINNESLQERIFQKQKHLQCLKDLFLDTAKAKSDNSNGVNLNLQKLLADSDDEDTPSGSKRT